MDNGTVLRARVIDAAEAFDAGLARWIARAGGLPVLGRGPHGPGDDGGRPRRHRPAPRLPRRGRGRRRAPPSWYLTETDGLPPLADVGVQVVERHPAVPAAQALAAQRPALGPRLQRAAGRPRDHRRCGGAPRRGPVRPAPGRRHPRGGRPVPGPRGRLRRRRPPALRQPGAGPHLPPGRRRRVAEAGPAAAARRRRAGCPSVCHDRFAVVVALWLAAVTRLPLPGAVLPEVDDPDADACELRPTTVTGRALVSAGLVPRRHPGVRRRGRGHAGGARACEASTCSGRRQTIGGPRIRGGNRDRNPHPSPSNAVVTA